MRDDLLTYYERELAYVRQLGAEFAQKYPKIASRLMLEPDKCEDPHVERLIEGFSFLAARVHLRLDDEFPEVTESLLNVLYPHYLAPIPSMSVVQFTLDSEQGKLTTGYEVARGTALYSRPIQGTPCRFRTAYPVTLWPVEVTGATLESLDPVDTRGRWEEAVIRLKLRCLHETKLSELNTGAAGGAPRPLESLRFYLHGEPQVTHALYEMIFNDVTRVELRPEGGKQPGRAGGAAPPLMLPPSSIRPVGFGADEGLLPYTARSFAGYRLLTEYFSFPEKFLFFDLTGLGEAARRGDFGSELSVSLYVKDVVPPRGGVGPDTFQLGCAPVVNLFTKVAEPIQLTQQQNEYRVVADVHRQLATEVYSVDAVTSTDPYLKQSRHYEPFYSIRHAERGERAEAFWYATRRPSRVRDDPGTEVHLTLVDLGFNPRVPAEESLTVRVTATNRDLPGKLPFGGRDGDFEVEGTGPLARVRCLRKPTQTVRPPLRRGAQWRLISHLSLNHLSLAGAGGGGVFLFASVLEQFLGLYVTVNSFNQLVARTRQREEVLKRWPPRAGDQALL